MTDDLGVGGHVSERRQSGTGISAWARILHEALLVSWQPMSDARGSRIPRPRGVYWLPNLLTTGALFAGFYAIVAAIDWRFDHAGVAVFVAMVFDGLDGRVARWTHTESAFGKEYDSLSDMVSFGAGARHRHLPVGCRAHRRVRPALAPTRLAGVFFLCRGGGAAARALQLALGDPGQALFRGAAEPLGGRHRRGLDLAGERPRSTSVLPGLIVAFVVTACAGALMISRFAFYSFKHVDAGARVRFTQIVLVPLAFVFIFLYPADLAAADLRQLCARPRRPCGCTASCSAALAQRADAGMNPALRKPIPRGPGPRRPGCCAPPGRRERAAPSRRSAPCRGPRRRRRNARQISAGRSCAPRWRRARAAPSARRAPRRCSASADLEAEWLIVGEAPGAEEDRRGEPFVGRAGQLLNSMLRAIGLAREQVYIANVLKCRPPGNRDPAPPRARECLPYLERQIALLQPKIMLAVGRIAAQNLLEDRCAARRGCGGRCIVSAPRACRWWSRIIPPICCARRPRSARRGRI